MKTKVLSPLKHTQRDYNMGFKLAIISQVEKGEMTYKQTQRACGNKVEVLY